MSWYHIVLWRRKEHLRNFRGPNRSTSKKFWEIDSELVSETKISAFGAIECMKITFRIPGQARSYQPRNSSRLTTVVYRVRWFYYGFECLHLENNGSHCLSWKSLHCTCGPFLICNECIMDLIVFVWFWMPSFSNYLGGHCIALAGLFSLNWRPAEAQLRPVVEYLRFVTSCHWPLDGPRK